MVRSRQLLLCGGVIDTEQNTSLECRSGSKDVSSRGRQEPGMLLHANVRRSQMASKTNRPPCVSVSPRGLERGSGGRGGGESWEVPGQVNPQGVVPGGVSHLHVSNSLRPRGRQPTRLLCPWHSPGKNTGVGSHALLQGIFQTQGSNLDLLYYRQFLHL